MPVIRVNKARIVPLRSYHNACADQSIEELNRFGAELFEALAKQLLFAAPVFIS